MVYAPSFQCILSVVLYIYYQVIDEYVERNHAQYGFLWNTI